MRLNDTLSIWLVLDECRCWLKWFNPLNSFYDFLNTCCTHPLALISFLEKKKEKEKIGVFVHSLLSPLASGSTDRMRADVDLSCMILFANCKTLLKWFTKPWQRAHANTLCYTDFLKRNLAALSVCSSDLHGTTRLPASVIAVTLNSSLEGYKRTFCLRSELIVVLLEAFSHLCFPRSRYTFLYL